MAIETLSTESRFTAERSGTGSPSGSSTTSLAIPRMVVVHGATSARRCRGITASRDKTTTGRRPISAISHHQTSPRAGRAVTMPRPHFGTKPGRPTRPARRADARRRRHSSHPLGLSGIEPAERQELRPQELRLWSQPALFEHSREAPRQLWCSNVCEPCHHHATYASREEGGPGCRSRTGHALRDDGLAVNPAGVAAVQRLERPGSGPRRARPQRVDLGSGNRLGHPRNSGNRSSGLGRPATASFVPRPQARVDEWKARLRSR